MTKEVSEIKILGHHNQSTTRQGLRRRRRLHQLQSWLMLAILLMPLLQMLVIPANHATAGEETATMVNKDNFLDYFAVLGDATYDQANGVVTLTKNENNQVGNFSLKTKIDMKSSFVLKGQVNLGNKTSSGGGADGISFAFHKGNTDDVGNAGGNLGIGGLPNATGFKLDTWHNDAAAPTSDEDWGRELTPDEFGWDSDPDLSHGAQFGGFVKTSERLIQNKDGKSVRRWWATTNLAKVQKLSSTDLDGNWRDFTITYDGKGNLTIKYKDDDHRQPLTWHTTVDSAEAMAMIVSASTGGAKNLQQFKLYSFTFTQAATVNVKYVNTEGKEISTGEVSYPEGPYVNKTYQTDQLTIPGYSWLKMDYDGAVTGIKSLKPGGSMPSSGDSGTVVYVYTKGIGLIGQKTWVDNGNADHTRPDSVTFTLMQSGHPYLVNGNNVMATASATTDWKYSFSGLPEKDADGHDYRYTVEEGAVPGYASTTNDNINFTNVLEPGTTSVSGIKNWADEDNKDGLRPTEITLNLFGEDKQKPQRTQTVKAGNDNRWQYTFRNLPKYDKNGVKIDYTVQEEKVAGYESTVVRTDNGFNLTNTHKLLPTLRLKIVKVDENGNPIANAKFEVTKGNSKQTLVSTDEAEGVTLSNSLRVNRTYTLTEKSAPSGYQLNETVAQISVNANADKTDVMPEVSINDEAMSNGEMSGDYVYSYDAQSRTIILTVTDHAQTILPHTGGKGDHFLLALALILLGMAVALASLTWLRRREVRDHA